MEKQESINKGVLLGNKKVVYQEPGNPIRQLKGVTYESIYHYTIETVRGDFSIHKKLVLFVKNMPEHETGVE